MNEHRPTLVRCGFVALALGLAGAAGASVPGAPIWLMYLAWVSAGVGAGLTTPNLSVLVLAHTTDADRARDSAALQLADGVASAFTIGFGGVLVAAAAHGHLGYTAAFVLLDVSLLGLSLVGVLAAGRVSRRRSP
jgi:MFS family permease